MPELTWQYTAEDMQGQIVRGQLEALSEQAALRTLEKDNLIPLNLQTSRLQYSSSRVILSHGHVLSLTDYATISRGLADLLTAGVPVADALSLLSKRQKKKKLQRFFDNQLRRVRSGTSLGASLDQDKANIPRVMAALVAAGEASGKLDEQFLIVAETLERTVKLRRELIGQIIYPIALLVLVVLTMIFLSYFVLPQFENIFSSADATPPPETRAVLAAGAWIRQYGSFLPAVVIILILFTNLALKRYKYVLSRSFLKLPYLGSWLLKIETGKYCRSLGALLTGGTPLSDSLPIATKAISSPYIQEQFKEAATHIRAGMALSTSLERYKLASNEVIGLVEIGEASGELGPMLSKAAQFCEDDIGAVLTRITSLSGPALTAIMGLITAVVIASVMSGVLSLNDAVY